MTDAHQSASAPAALQTEQADEFASLLKQSFKPRTERQATEVENAVATLVREALADENVVKEDVLDTIEAMIAKLDEKLSTTRTSRSWRAPGAGCTISSSIRRPTRTSRSR
jgi:type VI secretion system protein ImpC